MYAYSEFDSRFVHERAAQYRDQLTRHLNGQLPEDEFKPLRLQNGWYVQRHAPMLRVAIPYGVMSSAQMRVLATIATEFDRGYAHATTRQNFQFNWIALHQSADVMDLLASVGLHGIQTSGNCIRNTTTDVLAGVAADEIADPRPWAEIIRQWSTLHPEFAFLPRKFKIAINGAHEDRAATAWHDVGLHLVHNAHGELGFKVMAGGGMGRTPVLASTVSDFVPAPQILNHMTAILRVYNRFGRRDNLYKARIKILIKAEGQKFMDAVQSEFEAMAKNENGPYTLSQSDILRIQRRFEQLVQQPRQLFATHSIANRPAVLATDSLAFQRWTERNVVAHRIAGYKAVHLSLKRVGQAAGDITSAQMLAAADLSDRFSSGELRVSHDQNLALPWVLETDLQALHAAAKSAGFATPNIGLLTDMIVCPGGDFCALANARSLPIAATITERFQDIDELLDLGDIDFHMSGCINSCGHHHSGHIGVLGVDKDGQEWYQVTLGGSDGSEISGPAAAGKVIGPSFSADEVPDVVEVLLLAYQKERSQGEKFIDTVRRIGHAPFKAAAELARHVKQKHALTVANEAFDLATQGESDLQPA